MKRFGQRCLNALTPGVRVLLILLTLVYLAALAGKLTGRVDLYRWLAASGRDFWRGQIWRPVTYALLPMGICDFIMNGIALVVLGSLLERHWTRRELWAYCSVAATGAGLAAVLLTGAGSLPLTGTGPMVFGVLIAWACVAGHEAVLFPLLGQLPVRQVVLIFAAAAVVVMFVSEGLTASLVMACGGLSGWLYLRLREKRLMALTSRVAHSERINRLEL